MKKIFFLLTLYIFNLLPLTVKCQENQAIVAGKNIAIVQTEYGKVRGYIHHGMYTFKGIPYGKAKRFMPAEKPSSWEGIRSSMTYGPTCPAIQQDPFKDEFEFPLNRSRGYYISENCLNLNIWSKKISNVQKSPVMVWLHGGGFSSGSSIEFPSYDGENLSRKGNVVVVSINHRLNTLGFLDLSAYGEKYKYSANAGMMDIVAALNWIRENISNVGGDPDNVTVFGQSGGGAKVWSLMNTPSAKGLFHKAIIQSGSYLTHFIEPDISRQVAAETLKQLGLRPDQVDSLQLLPYERLAAAGEAALQSVKQSLPEDASGFGLEWDPVHDGDFLPTQPGEPSAIELSKNIPLLVGSCKNEYMPYILGPKPQTVAPSDNSDIDRLFRPLVIRQANEKSSTGAAPVYVYLFAWQSPVLDGAYKAFHCMDLPFVFNNISRCEEMTGGGPDACLLADKMSEAWIQFARHGNPNHDEIPNWPAYTVQNGATMIFDNNCQVKNDHDLAQGVAERTQDLAQGVADWQLEKMPVDLETDYALSALPPHLRNDATVYLLDPKMGYYTAHQGSNGYICFISRTDWEWSEYRNDLATPISYDAEGARSIFPIYQAVAAMRASGKFQASRIKDTIMNRIVTGIYKAPSKPGMSYMLAPVMRVYNSTPDSKEIVTISGPHYMLYAPYLSDDNARFSPGTEGLILTNPGNSILGEGKGPYGYIIVPASETEKAIIIEDGKDLMKRLAAYKAYFAVAPGTGHHH